MLKLQLCFGLGPKILIGVLIWNKLGLKLH